MKKSLLIVSLMMLASLANAEDLKTCEFVVKLPGQAIEIPTIYRIVKNGNVLSARTSQIIEGQSVELPLETAAISEADVRPNLDSSSSNLNEAEQFILGTEDILNNPQSGSFFNVGLNLKAIRHAKLYQVGKFTHMGGSVIIEAKDERGKDLGSFVTGFLPFACAR